MIRTLTWWSALLAMGAALVAVAPVAHGQPTPLAVWDDERTGLALSGYDPVAYFTDSEPKLGLAMFELAVDEPSAGQRQPRMRYYRFVSNGNMAAFIAHPEVYRPSYGGHDPVRLADGQISPGEIGLWAIHRQRLYLFRTPGARHLFLADPDGVLARITARETAEGSTTR